MTRSACVMMILISIRFFGKQYSLAKNIDTPLWHSINVHNRVCSGTVSLVTQGIHLADRFEMEKIVFPVGSFIF